MDGDVTRSPNAMTRWIHLFAGPLGWWLLSATAVVVYLVTQSNAVAIFALAASIMVFADKFSDGWFYTKNHPVVLNARSSFDVQNELRSVLVSFDAVKLIGVTQKMVDGRVMLFLDIKHSQGIKQSMDMLAGTATIPAGFMKVMHLPLDEVLDNPDTWRDLQRWMSMGTTRPFSFLTKANSLHKGMAKV